MNSEQLGDREYVARDCPKEQYRKGESLVGVRASLMMSADPRGSVRSHRAGRRGGVSCSTGKLQRLLQSRQGEERSKESLT